MAAHRGCGGSNRLRRAGVPERAAAAARLLKAGEPAVYSNSCRPHSCTQAGAGGEKNFFKPRRGCKKGGGDETPPAKQGGGGAGPLVLPSVSFFSLPLPPPPHPPTRPPPPPTPPPPPPASLSIAGGLPYAAVHTVRPRGFSPRCAGAHPSHGRRRTSPLRR